MNIDHELQPQFRANNNNGEGTSGSDDEDDEIGGLNIPTVRGKYSKLKENLATLLSTSLEMLDQATLRFEARSEFSRVHFNVTKWMQQYNIDKLLKGNIFYSLFQ